MPATAHLPPRPAFHPRLWVRWAGLAALWLLAQLPFRVQILIGALLGALAFRIAARPRAIADVNLRLCFPELDASQRAHLLRRHFRSLGIGLLEFGMGYWARPGMLRHRYRFTGLEHLDAAGADGRGVILLGAHFTTLEMGGLFLSWHRDMTVTYRPDRNPVLDWAVAHARARRHGLLTSDDVRGMVRALQAGDRVWYAPDENFPDRGHLFVPFFGVPAATNPNTARFAALGDARVVPFFARRDADDRGYEVIFQPALEDFPGTDHATDAARINRTIEDMIRLAPDQYLWIQKRFLKRPPNQPDVYHDVPR